MWAGRSTPIGKKMSSRCCGVFFCGAAIAETDAPTIGPPAPEFSALDSHGPTGRLSDFKSKGVVLEWTHAECPFTRKHYTRGNMQGLQALAQKNDMIRLSVISSAVGKQGYVTSPEADELTRTRGASPAAGLLDPSGTVGRLYQATTTPYLFVVDRSGVLQYRGGIDSIAFVEICDIASAQPYAKEVMLALVQRQPVPHPVTRSYGYSVKY